MRRLQKKFRVKKILLLCCTFSKFSEAIQKFSIVIINFGCHQQFEHTWWHGSQQLISLSAFWLIVIFLAMPLVLQNLLSRSASLLLRCLCTWKINPKFFQNFSSLISLFFLVSWLICDALCNLLFIRTFCFLLFFCCGNDWFFLYIPAVSCWIKKYGICNHCCIWCWLSCGIMLTFRTKKRAAKTHDKKNAHSRVYSSKEANLTIMTVIIPAKYFHVGK